MSFVDFAALKAAVTIDQVADMLSLTTKQEGSQLRTACPACKSGGDRAIVLTPAKGLFYCFSAKKGGDCIALAAHVMSVGNNDAANFLADQIGTVPVPDRDTVLVSKERATAPQKKPEGRKQPASSQVFDAVKFEASLAYTENVSALGVSEADAKLMAIGEKRGKVYVPVRWPSGSIAGWQYTDEHGQVHFPKTWLPDTAPNIVPFKRPA